MATETMLQIRGYRGEPVPNRLRRPQAGIDRLSLLLPGFGYTLDMPLFSCAENVLLERGWDVLRVEYAYSQRPEYQEVPESEQRRWLFEDATAAYRAGCAQRAYTEVSLIGKSLGSLAMGHFVSLEDQPSVITRAVWLTPLISVPALQQQIRQYRGSSLLFIGTADPHYDQETLDALLRQTSGQAVVIDGADHGMEIPGDPVGSVRAVERVTAALDRFLAP